MKILESTSDSKLQVVIKDNMKIRKTAFKSRWNVKYRQKSMFDKELPPKVRLVREEEDGRDRVYVRGEDVFNIR